MSIKQVLEMPIGSKFGGFDVVIKTCKKKWMVKDKWVQQVILSDDSGDILAEVNTTKKYSLNRNLVLHITVGIVQAGVPEVGKEGFKKIYIDQFTSPAISEPELDYSMGDKITRSKIKCWLVSAKLQANQPVDKTEINDYVDYIME